MTQPIPDVLGHTLYLAINPLIEEVCDALDIEFMADWYNAGPIINLNDNLRLDMSGSIICEARSFMMDIRTIQSSLHEYLNDIQCTKLGICNIISKVGQLVEPGVEYKTMGSDFESMAPRVYSQQEADDLNCNVVVRVYIIEDID